MVHHFFKNAPFVKMEINPGTGRMQPFDPTEQERRSKQIADWDMKEQAEIKSYLESKQPHPEQEEADFEEIRRMVEKVLHYRIFS